MGPKRWTALTLILLGSLAVGVPPASAIHCTQEQNCSEEGTFSMGPGSYAVQTPDPTPKTSARGSVDVAPFTADEAADFDSNWQTIVDAYPKLGGIKNVFVRRVVTCAIFARNITDLYAAVDKQVNGTSRSPDTSELFLTVCVLMVNATQRASASQLAHAASARCVTAAVSIPVEIKRAGSQYTVQFSATPSKAGRTPVVVSCRAKGTHNVISVHPRARKKRLYQVIPRLDIGFSNPTNHALKITSIFSFSR